MSKKTNDRTTKENYENKDFLIRLNYVETSEPDRVAKELQIKDQRILELEKRIGQDKKHIDKTDERLTELRKENAELKKKLESAANEYNALQEVLNEFDLEGYPDEIREKFKKVEEKLENTIVPRFKKFRGKVFCIIDNEILIGENEKIYNYHSHKYLIFLKNGLGNEWFLEEEIFATKEEAQQKLKELEGK